MSAARLVLSRSVQLGALTTVLTTYHLHRAPCNRIKHDSPAPTSLGQDASLVVHARRAQSRIERTETEQEASKRGDADLIHKATDTDVYSPGFEDDDDQSWALFSRNFDNLIEGISRIKWGGLGDKITEFVVPSWARHIPEGIQKLQSELSMEPGSLADEIWHEAHDPSINPEILWDARVRVGSELCPDELRFREKRKQHIRKAFAKYLDLKENDVDPDDIPTIAMCGSGGGLRALVAGTGSYLAAQNAGLFDCVMYTAGVSGSCWLQTLYYSSLGKQSHETLLRHIKSRIQTHIAFPPPALKLATSAPTNKFILSGFIEKLKGDPKADFGLVDIYSLLLGLRLLVPHGDLDVHSEDLKLSNQRAYIEQGQHPMPIYTAVRHEIPLDDEEKEAATDSKALKEKVKEKARKEAWFQWIEMHPWEIGCEEFAAWIPTWSFGRPFRDGRNQVLDTGIAIPEIRLSLLLGIWGSAFTATLAHYYKEIRPLLAGITGFGGLNELLEEKNDDLIKIHPIDPATIPNWVYGMKSVLPSSCPDSIFQNDHLQLMDAGMSNNLPCYPLLREGRDVEILVAFDASADIQKENWLSVVDGYATQRGIKAWPLGTGWPKKSAQPTETVEALVEAQASTTAQSTAKVEQAKQPPPKDPPFTQPDELGPCNIWVGTKSSRTTDTEPPPSKRLDYSNPEDSTFHLMQPDAGITVIYFPLLPHPDVPGIDPDKTDFLSTWNFIYTPEQVDSVVELARRNWLEGEEKVKRTVRAVYERKKRGRLEEEKRRRIKWLKRGLRGLEDFSGD
jgi:cytosolic phospholipase A2